jgi:hypothetical protein
MNQPSAYHQLGLLIVQFQHLEDEITQMLVMLSTAEDEEAARILVNELDYSQRVKTVDVLFARTVDLQRVPDVAAKAEFHSLMVEAYKLGKRRNELVHSTYAHWVTVEGQHGVIRENSRLRARRGVREESQEELVPEAFSTDFARLSKALEDLDRFRLKVIDWLYPDEQS